MSRLPPIVQVGPMSYAVLDEVIGLTTTDYQHTRMVMRGGGHVDVAGGTGIDMKTLATRINKRRVAVDKQQKQPSAKRQK